MTWTLGGWQPLLHVVAGSVATIAAVKLAWTVYRKRGIKATQIEYQDGVVYLHIFPRKFTKKVVNISPFAIKVETWCRMFGVPYQVVETSRFSPKENHIPYVVYNGEIQADSTLIIELLQDVYNQHDDLNSFEKGVARSIMRMMDDTFVLLYFYYRYSLKGDEFYKYFRMKSLPKFLQYYVFKQLGKRMKQRCLMNGFARYGVDHVIKLGKQDLEALENILGDKEYMLGDTPTTVDATVFGHLSQILYPDLSYPWKEFIITECPRLLNYCTRIKKKFWPDWDSLVEHDTF